MNADPARTRLLHLLDRLRRGVLLPAERDLLADAVTAVLAELEQAAIDAAYEAEGERKRAERAERERDEARKCADLADRELDQAATKWDNDLAKRTTTLLIQAEEAKKRATTAEAATRTHKAAAVDALERAEQAEAAITRVRAAVTLAREHANPLSLACFRCGTDGDHLADIAAALDGEQPAEPERCPAQNTAMPDRTAHCDLTTGHEGHHRDSTVPGVLRWTEEAAVWPASSMPAPAEPRPLVINLITNPDFADLIRRTVQRALGSPS